MGELTPFLVHLTDESLCSYLNAMGEKMPC